MILWRMILQIIKSWGQECCQCLIKKANRGAYSVLKFSGDENLYLDNYIKNPFAEENIFLHRKAVTEELPVYAQAKDLLPQPYWDGHEDTVSCYWKAWELAFGNLKKPTLRNGFPANYIDQPFNGCIFMWDSCFMLMFTKYGKQVFDFQQTLDNFYAKQHPDGFICREIVEESGLDHFHRFDPVSTGPNIFPLAEWEYYKNYGDIQRLRDVFPALTAYHLWTKTFRTWRDGSYWSSGWGCGMDNLPRTQKFFDRSFTNGKMVWVDTCMQQILSAKILLRISREIGREKDISDFQDEVNTLTRYVNERLWDPETGFYYDLWPENNRSGVKTIGSYWALLADVVPKENLDRFVGHLKNKAEFDRPYPIPALSSDHPEYNRRGGYWAGGIWTPTNYMVFKGLDSQGYFNLAHELAVRHLDEVVQVFRNTGTIWENYAPETAEHGKPAMPDFVGWSGLTPIAVLFEYVFGIRPHASQSVLEWNVSLTQAHGIIHYPFGKTGVLNLKCEKRDSIFNRPKLEIKSNVPVTVLVKWPGGTEKALVLPNL